MWTHNLKIGFGLLTVRLSPTWRRSPSWIFKHSNF